MSNKPLEAAKKLKKEADRLLEDFAITLTLSQYGTVIPTGSYALDLLAWNDVDLILQLESGVDPALVLANLAYDFILNPEIPSVKIERNLNQKRPELPEGSYLQLKIPAFDYKLPWKFDIWILDDDQIEENKSYMEKLKKALSPEKRELILEMKHRIMLPSGRTPSLSGHYLYQAILLDNMTDKEAILDYLAKHIPISR